jgi:hypothetical protein
MLVEVNDPIVDIDDALFGFGPTTTVARRSYLKRVNAMLAHDERTEVPERLPWWRPERELRPTTGRAYVDVLGRSTGLERERLEVREFIELACAGLGIPSEGLIGPRKDRATTRRRELVATVGIERWEQRAAEIGSLLGKHPDVVSRWARAGANRRCADPQFARAIEELDVFLSETKQQ